jgi:uncharacterized membrane protein YfcA
MLVFVFGAFAGGFAVGLAGFGAGPVLLAFWLHLMPPTLAAPVLALCVGAGQLQAFHAVRRAFEWQRVWPFLVGGLFGVPIGTAILLYVSGDALKQWIGVFLVLYAILFLVTGKVAKFTAGGRPADAVAGFGAGVACGAASVPGPPMNIWCSLRGWPKDVQRATFQPFNISVIVVVAVIYAFNDLITMRVVTLAAIALPFIAVGARMGLIAYRHIDEAQYRMLLLYTLLGSGVLLVWPS